MNSVLHITFAIVCAALLLATPAHAVDSVKPHHDLVFGLSDDVNKPFYETGNFMLGDKAITVEPGVVSGKDLAAYDAKSGKIIVSNDKTIAEADKGAAVLQLMDSLAIGAIEPAAGR